MTEADCLAYCKERGYDWGGLYDKMRRVSCWCCPLQSLAELRVLYQDFPDLWEQLKRWGCHDLAFLQIGLHCFATGTTL